LASWYDAARFMTLEEPLQSALYEALPRLLPLFPSTISRRVVSTLFLLPFDNQSSTITSAQTAAVAGNTSSGQERRRHHRFAVRALESLHGVQSESAKLPPPVIAELHQSVLEVYRCLPGPVRVIQRPLARSRGSSTKGAASTSVRVKIDAKRLELLTLVTSSMASLPPLLLESSLPADGHFTRQAEERMKGGGTTRKPTAKNAGQLEELEATAKGITLRCLLVERKVLPLSSLHACRTWCLSQSGGTALYCTLAMHCVGASRGIGVHSRSIASLLPRRCGEDGSRAYGVRGWSAGVVRCGHQAQVAS
jgi:hypothetical protein